jgi:hypothetical protein
MLRMIIVSLNEVTPQVADYLGVLKGEMSSVTLHVAQPILQRQNARSKNIVILGNAVILK